MWRTDRRRDGQTEIVQLYRAVHASAWWRATKIAFQESTIVCKYKIRRELVSTHNFDIGWAVASKPPRWARLSTRWKAFLSTFHPSGVSKWVPAAAGKAKAGMAHFACGWNAGCACKTVLSLDNACVLYMSTLETLRVDALYKSTAFFGRTIGQTVYQSWSIIAMNKMQWRKKRKNGNYTNINLRNTLWHRRYSVSKFQLLKWLLDMFIIVYDSNLRCLHRVSKTVACLIFYNLKKLEPLFIMFATLYIYTRSSPSFKKQASLSTPTSYLLAVLCNLSR